MALKHSYFFRPTSRPSSPAPGLTPTAGPPSRPDSAAGLAPDRARSLNRLAFTTFKRASPAPSPARVSPPPTLVQDGSYLEALGLKLSEAVSKALAQPAGPAGPQEQLLAGRRPIPAGRGTQLGAVIAGELNAAAGNPHLRRAVIRSLQRPMSVMLTSLSGNLLPLLSSPAFTTPLVPTVQAPNPNPTQTHALAYATFSGELLECFDEMGLGLDSDMRGDGLKPVREGLVSMVGRVVNPLINGLKAELAPLIEALEQPAVAPATAAVPAVKGAKVTPSQHPSIVTLQAIMPVYARALVRYTTTPSAQTNSAQLLISLIWRGLVALANRVPPPSSPPTTPKLSPGGLKKPRTLSSTTPPTTPPAGRFALKLPPSRPPSPPGTHASRLSGVAPPPTPAGDARVLYELLAMLPRPDADKDATRLAREAVDEAFDALRTLGALLDAVQHRELLDPAIGADAVQLGGVLEGCTADLPTLVALPVLLRAYVPAAPPVARADAGALGLDTNPEPPRVLNVAGLLGMGEEEYRKGCLYGFGRAEQCAMLVGRRVLDALDAQLDAETEAHEPAAAAVARWLEARVEFAEDMEGE